MIDGIKLMARIEDFDVWKKNTGLSFKIQTDIDSGEVFCKKEKKNPNQKTYKYSCKHETYFLTVKEVVTNICSTPTTISCILIIEGSLHKNYFGGNNYEQFTFGCLQTEINKLCKSLKIEASKLTIQNLEVGVNLKTPFTVKDYINNSLLFHSTKPFENYDSDKSGYVLGRVSKHSQFSVKCYDKGVQNSLQYNLMRFEVRCVRMQYLNKYGIKTLKDLTDFNKVVSLENVLLNAWKDVLIFENDVKLRIPEILPDKVKLISDGENRDSWSRYLKFGSKKFDKQRSKFRNLMKHFSKQNSYNLIQNLIKEEWSSLVTKEVSLKDEKMLQMGEGIFIFKVKAKNSPTLNLSL